MQAPTPAPSPPRTVEVPQLPPLPAIPQITPPSGGDPIGAYIIRVPRTEAELDALRRLRSELSNQVQSARRRRSELANQYERASGANRSGLEQQLVILDRRIVRLEQDIAESGRALAATDMGTLAGAPFIPFPFRMQGGQIAGISVVFTLFVLAPLALAAARRMWRRSSGPVTPPGWADSAHRLERLEQAVDTIAIEIERISEGQRFMTKIMTQATAAENAGAGRSGQGQAGEGQPLALGSGSPDQLFAAQNEREAERVRRR